MPRRQLESAPATRLREARAWGGRLSPPRKPHAIGDAVRALRARAEPATPLAAVQSAWGPAVGERIAAQAQPVRESDGEVTVACRASTWAQELDLLQVELLARLNASLARGRVDSLRFVVGTEPFRGSH